MSDRSCTCHPDEAPKPCQKRYALSECQAARIEQLEAARLRFWCDAHKGRQNEPLVITYEITVRKFPALG